VATALSGLVAFALREAYPAVEQRQQALDTLIEFMRNQTKNGWPPGRHPDTLDR
jgi:hypothetical protein